jgi:hypothetical protein
MGLLSVLGLIVFHCKPAFVQPTMGPTKDRRVMRGTADITHNFGFGSATADGGAGSSWFTWSQAVAMGAVLGLVMAFGSAPAMASNEASGYREKDQSIISYNGNKAVGGKNKKLPEEEMMMNSSKLLGKMGGFKTEVAPEAQITLDELQKIDPNKQAKK